MRLAFALITFALLLPGACITVPSGQIAAKDIASAVPLFASLEPETMIGFAPLPGVQRVISARELAIFAQRHGLPLDPALTLPNVCVVRATHVLAAGEVRKALVASLRMEDARLELLDFSNQPMPSGNLEFPLPGLNKPPPDAPETPVLWKGQLVYDGQRSLAFWAKVRITVERLLVISAEQIPAGTRIEPSQIRLSRGLQFPFSGPSLDSLSQVAGRISRRTILPGQPLRPADLGEAKDVLPGDTVRARVIDGLATLSLDAVAESSGTKGDTVVVRNPATGKSFRGIVDDKGKIVVLLSGGGEQ